VTSCRALLGKARGRNRRWHRNVFEGRDWNPRVAFWPPMIFTGLAVMIVGLILGNWEIAGCGFALAVLAPISAWLYLWFLLGVRRIVQRLSSKRDDR
jgi:hypothetical protein